LKVQILMFAQARQILNQSEVSLDIPDDASVSQLRIAVGKSWPELQPLLDRSSFSLNGAYAGESDPIPVDAEIAMIPPVSGG